MGKIHTLRSRHAMSITSAQPSISAAEHSAELSLLLHLIDESYNKKAWHGPNLKGSIRRVSAELAEWRPQPLRHSIVENVIHCAYWKYAVRRRLTGEKRGSFTLKGSNWFAIGSRLTEGEWKEYTALLEQEHRVLCEVVAAFPPGLLAQFAPGGKWRYASLISGIALHDVYHAGQIQLLKRLHGTRE